MAKDDVDKLIDDYKRTVDALHDDATTGVNTTRDAWKKMKNDKYTSSAWAKDMTESYARSVNTWRKLIGDWLK